MPSNATIVILGGLTKDPYETTYNDRFGNPQKVLNLNVGVNTAMQDKEGNWISNYFNVAMFGQLADYYKEKLSKGKQVEVVGDFVYQTYQKDGQERHSLNIKASKITIIPLYSKGGSNNERPRNLEDPPRQQAAPAENAAPAEDPNTLPF